MDARNGIYTGRVRHRRLTGKLNAFTYKVFMMYCNVNELAEICSKSVFFSFNRFNIASFFERDYLPEYTGTIYQRVCTAIAAEGYSKPVGDIFLLANWRYFGYLINPICCYYCFDKNQQLQYMVLEVTNTPWGDHQVYVLPCDPEQSFQRLKFSKTMHVSPFYPLDMGYDLRCHIPNEKLSLHINNTSESGKVFDATMALKHEAVTANALSSILWRYPLMTIKVLLAIYWQALKLYVRGQKFIPKVAAATDKS